MAVLPTWDEALATPQTPEEPKSTLPTWDEALKTEQPSAISTTWRAAKTMGALPYLLDPSKENIQDMNEAQREFMKNTAVGRIMSAFGHGFDEGVGDEMYGPSEETRKFMQKVGLFNDYEKGQSNFVKGTLEGLVLPSADYLFRKTMVGPYVGYQWAVMQLGKEVGSPALGRDLALLPEAFPFGLKTSMGIPHAPHIVKKGVSEGIIGVSEDVAMGLKEATPEQMKKMNEATQEIPTPEDIHTIAERIDPETVTRYREMETTRNNLREMIEEHRNTNAKQVEDALSSGKYGEEIAELQKKVDDAKARGNKSVYEEMLNKKLAERAETVEKARSKDTPEIEALQFRVKEANYQMRNMAEKYRAAYREADAQIPKDEVGAPSTKPAEQMTVENYVDDYIAGKGRDSAEHRQFASNFSKEIEAEFQKRAQEGRPVKTPEEQRQTITDDFTRKWVEAGHNAEEANAFGGYVALRFEELSRRLGGKKSALELYNERSADVVAGRERKVAPQELAQTTKGKIRRATDDAKALITRFKRSDFSTMVHETGHEWLDDLLRDAVDDMASVALKKDAQIVRDWLKAEGELTTRQHEKFARSFERYFMEGVAPNKEMSGVFAQFKQWMMNIYKWIDEKRYPINDDIRDVFHRFVTENPERTIIAPEKESGKMSAAIHEADAVETPPARAAEAIETMRREADETAKLDPEIADAIATRPTEGQPTAAGKTGTPVGGMPEPGKATAAEKPEAVGPSGNIARAEGDQPLGDPEPWSAPKGPNEQMGRPVDGYVDKAGNIRLDNLNTPEDVNAVLREIAEENEGFLGARRGVISDAQALDLADSLGMDAKTLNLRKIGEAFNAEQIIGARKLLIQSATETREAMVKAAIGDDAAVMKYAEMRQRHQMIQEQVSGITAEAGRALRAFREIGGAQDAKLLTEFLQSQTGKTLYELKQEAMLGAKLDTPQKVSKFINDSKKSTLRDMVVEAWINGLLSGPITFATNLKGNLAVALYSIPETGLAGMIGGVRRALTGNKEGVRIAEAKGRLFGLLEGSREGVVTVGKIFNDEDAMAAFVGNTTTETKKMQAIPKKIGEVVRIPSRLMTATDAVFKSSAYRSEINAMAWRKATEEGLEGQAFMQRVAELTRNPTDEMMKSASQYRNYQTFTRELGEFGQALQRMANTDLWGMPIPKVLIPFIRTPGNLIKYAGERTPLGVLSREVRDNIFGKNGKVAQDTQMARIALGTTVGLATVSLAIEGLITGGGPSDPEERAKWRLAGWQPYSLKIGDSYYSYARLDPFATILGITADAVETVERKGVTEEEKDSIGELLFWSFTENLLSKLSLRGASDIIQAVTDRDRYGDRYVQRISGTVVPNFLAQAARTMDPVQRETYNVLEALKSRIPGMREDLLPRRDVWGEPIVSQGAAGPDILSSVYISRLSNDPVNQRLLSINYSPSKLGRNIRGVELTPKQYDDYQRLAGRMAKMRLDAIVKQPGFSEMPEFVQINVIKKTIDSSRETTRSLMMMQNPDIIQKALNIKRGAVTGNTSQSTQ